jgi:lysophospholipase L1-like esterase
MSAVSHAQGAPAWIAEPSQVNGWLSRHEQLKLALAKAKPSVLFVGDSLTARWTGAGLATWEDHFFNLNAFNAGIEGETTQGLLWRIQSGEFSNITPAAVVVLIGTNNVSRSNDDVSIAKGIDASAKALKVHLPRSRVILLGILPRGDLNDDVRRRIMKINRLLIQADAQSEYAFCDIGKVLLTEDGDLYWDSYMQDKLHLISGGYSRIAEPITKLLAEDSVKCD